MLYCLYIGQSQLIRRRGSIYLVVARQLELQLDGLLQTFEAPVLSSARIHRARCESLVPFRLFLLQRGHAQKFIYGSLGVVGLELLCVVVLVLDIDIAALLVIVVFVFKIIPAASQRVYREYRRLTYSSSPESCMKSSSSDMFAVWVVEVRCMQWDYY